MFDSIAFETALRAHAAEAAGLAPRLRAREPGALADLDALARRAHFRLRSELRGRPGRSLLGRARVALDDLVRTSEVEELDRDDVPEERKRILIEGLGDMNRRLLAYEAFTRMLAPLVERAALLRRGAPVRVLELGSGHGELAFHLERWGRAQGIPLEIAASDIGPVYVALGAAKARARGSRVRFERIDALDMDLPSGSRDVVLLTQTVHHFDPGQVARLFAEATRVGGAALFVDGYRHPALMAGLGAALALFRRRTLLHDGWISIRKVYAQDELALLAALCPEGARASVEAWPPGYSVVRFPAA